MLLTKTQLTNAETEELEDSRSRIEGELSSTTCRLSGGSLAASSRRVRTATAGMLRLEHVKCGKERCKKCIEGEGHGTYWYLC
ncbi:MAG: hypothetical protein JOZ19_14300 [Rubrobacter sp.]|nr:hypothetical protein [Rubrobacter sp.]